MIGKEVVWAIAEIQVEALQNILDNADKLEESLIYKYIECGSPDIKSAILRLKDLYMSICNHRDPEPCIRMLSEYQLGICIHILFRMEDQWIDKFSQKKVNSVWALLFDAKSKFHPEYALIRI